METLARADLGGGWTLTHFDEVASTNAELVSLAQGGAGEGTALSADHQSAGKGRLGREWDDVPGSSILLSVLVRPKFTVNDYFAATCAMSVAAVESLRALGVSASIKWPNDLLLGKEKISGILAEAGESPSGRFVVVGVGMNVNQDREQLARLGRPATSLRETTGRLFDAEARDALRLDLLKRFKEAYAPLQDSFAPAFADLLGRYRTACATLEAFVRVELSDGEIISGHVLDISNQGHLLVELDSCIRTVSAGDVEHLYA
ncbi:MAG: biotin--[acetyl-CoA-carboxylase] ligase [Actinomycetota bacterium]|nr:biotin--[acetyl-CoA-carboxylase] ligase [Actinomycetota bacterium]